MTLAPAKPGGWSLNEILTSAQLNALQAEVVKAIDGASGGSYTPAAPLSLDGTINIAGGTLNVKTGADAIVESGGDLRIKTGAIATVEDIGTLRVADQDATVDVALAGCGVSFASGSPGWFWEPSVGRWRQLSVSGATGVYVMFPLRLTPGDLLDEIRVTVDGATDVGDRSVLPEFLPRALLVRGNPGAAGVTTVANITDSSPSAAFYSLPHNIVLGSLAHTVLSVPYYLTIFGEQGTDSTAGVLSIQKIAADVTRKRLLAHLQPL